MIAYIPLVRRLFFYFFSCRRFFFLSFSSTVMTSGGSGDNLCLHVFLNTSQTRAGGVLLGRDVTEIIRSTTVLVLLSVVRLLGKTL